MVSTIMQHRWAGVPGPDWATCSKGDEHRLVRSYFLNAQYLGPGSAFCSGGGWYWRDSCPDRVMHIRREPSVCHLIFLLHLWLGGLRATERPPRSLCWLVDPRPLWLAPLMASNPGSLQGQLLLGAVGAFNWSGGALLYDMHGLQGRFLNQTAADANAAPFSYLGKGGAWRLPGWGRGLMATWVGAGPRQGH